MASRASLAPSARVVLLLLSALLLPACGGPSEPPGAPPDAAPVALSGTYEVRGLTTVIGTDRSRELSGTLILVQEGDTYTATFDLATVYPAPGGAVPAEVIGSAEGTIDGAELEGTAHTQIVASRIQGIDPGFTLVPPAFGVRVVSTATGRVRDDGSIEFQLENRGAGGADYVPTRTRVEGVRVPD